MKSSKRLKVFKNELKAIKKVSVRNFTEAVLLELPDYFFKIPASSSGKHHPKYCLGKGGLVRHTKACVKMALELFTIFNDFSAMEQDLVISALILHDGCKNGLFDCGHTTSTHPLDVCSLIKNKTKKSRCAKQVRDLISSHMGQWNTDYETGEIILPFPETDLQKFVHMCDYIASRRDIVVNLK